MRLSRLDLVSSQLCCLSGLGRGAKRRARKRRHQCGGNAFACHITDCEHQWHQPRFCQLLGFAQREQVVEVAARLTRGAEAHGYL
jgi:hypothetical protein